MCRCKLVCSLTLTRRLCLWPEYSNSLSVPSAAEGSRGLTLLASNVRPTVALNGFASGFGLRGWLALAVGSLLARLLTHASRLAGSDWLLLPYALAG